jgi:hypothetical protein
MVALGFRWRPSRARFCYLDFNSSPSQVDCKDKPDWARAYDQHSYFVASRHTLRQTWIISSIALRIVGALDSKLVLNLSLLMRRSDVQSTRCLNCTSHPSASPSSRTGRDRQNRGRLESDGGCTSERPASGSNATLLPLIKVHYPGLVKQAVNQQFARWVMLHVQSNPLPICTRPRVLIKGKRT